MFQFQVRHVEHCGDRSAESLDDDRPIPLSATTNSVVRIGT